MRRIWEAIARDKPEVLPFLVKAYRVEDLDSPGIWHRSDGVVLRWLAEVIQFPDWEDRLLAGVPDVAWDFPSDETVIDLDYDVDGLVDYWKEVEGSHIVDVKRDADRQRLLGEGFTPEQARWPERELGWRREEENPGSDSVLSVRLPTSDGKLDPAWPAEDLEVVETPAGLYALAWHNAHDLLTGSQVNLDPNGVWMQIVGPDQATAERALESFLDLLDPELRRWWERGPVVARTTEEGTVTLPLPFVLHAGPGELMSSRAPFRRPGWSIWLYTAPILRPDPIYRLHSLWEEAQERPYVQGEPQWDDVLADFANHALDAPVQNAGLLFWIRGEVQDRVRAQGADFLRYHDGSPIGMTAALYHLMDGIAEARLAQVRGGDEGEDELDSDDEEEVVTFKDGAAIVELLTSKALVVEGKRMKHCVGQEQHGHPRLHRQGAIRIFSYRDPDEEPQATLEVNTETFQATDFQGPGNGRIRDPNAKGRMAWFYAKFGPRRHEPLAIEYTTQRLRAEAIREALEVLAWVHPEIKVHPQKR